MDSTGEREAVTPCSRMDNKESLLTDGQQQIQQIFIKQENLLTDELPETEQIYIKEENIELEALEDYGGRDPLKVEQGDYVSEEETCYPNDAPYIKQDPECVLEEETTTPPGPSQIKIQLGLQESSCDSERESGVEENRSEDLPTGLGKPAQCTDDDKASCDQTSTRKYFVLSCTICKRTFANLHDLKEHNNVGCCKFLPSCRVCGKAFSTHSTFKKHKCVYTGEHHFSCDQCQKTFRTSLSLTIHLRMHTRDNHVCEVCHKTFKSSIYLKRHSLLHMSGHCYICDICEKPIKISSKVEKGNRLSVCQSCDKLARKSTQPKQYSS